MNEWVFSNVGMILTGENWSIGRKTLYGVGGRWMNMYGAMVEWYWQGKTNILGFKLVTVPLRPPQIAHAFAWDWTKASNVWGRRLTPLAVAWPWRSAVAGRKIFLILLLLRKNVGLLNKPSTNSVEDRGQRELGSGGGSPLVRGSGGSCNLVQEI